MVLSSPERHLLQTSWAKVAGCEELGGEILDRLFLVYPSSKTYFPHLNLNPGSADVKAQGQKIIQALENAIKHMDILRDTLGYLSDLHAYNLRVDPVNFKLLGKCIHVVLAIHLRNEYTPLCYLAFDKFLAEVSEILCEKYR